MLDSVILPPFENYSGCRNRGRPQGQNQKQTQTQRDTTANRHKQTQKSAERKQRKTGDRKSRNSRESKFRAEVKHIGAERRRGGHRDREGDSERGRQVGNCKGAMFKVKSKQTRQDPKKGKGKGQGGEKHFLFRQNTQSGPRSLHAG